MRENERDALIESLRIFAKDCDSYSPDVCGTLIEGIGFIAMRHLLNKAAEALAAPAAGGQGEAVPYCYEVKWADGVTAYPKTMPARTENALVTPLYNTAPPAASVDVQTIALIANMAAYIRAEGGENAGALLSHADKLIDSAGGAKSECDHKWTMAHVCTECKAISEDSL